MLRLLIQFYFLRCLSLPLYPSTHLFSEHEHLLPGTGERAAARRNWPLSYSGKSYFQGENPWITVKTVSLVIFAPLRISVHFSGPHLLTIKTKELDKRAMRADFCLLWPAVRPWMPFIWQYLQATFPVGFKQCCLHFSVSGQVLETPPRQSVKRTCSCASKHSLSWRVIRC